VADRTFRFTVLGRYPARLRQNATAVTVSMAAGEGDHLVPRALVPVRPEAKGSPGRTRACGPRYLSVRHRTAHLLPAQATSSHCRSDDGNPAVKAPRS
jgi:hypothetical protein